MVCKMGCASARTGTHAGIATVPRTVATLTGCPVRVLRKDTTNKKAQGEMPCAFCWSGLRDSPGALLRAPARTRAPQQSPGLLLPWRVALFESRAKILRTKKHKAKCLVLFVGADYETRPVRFCAHRHARGHRNSPPDCCYPDGLPCSSLSIIVEQKKQGKKPCFLYWSGLRDSNSLPPPWQGGALPDELNPQTIVLLYPAGAGLSSPFFADGNKKCRPLVGITIGTTTYR